MFYLNFQEIHLNFRTLLLFPINQDIEGIGGIRRYRRYWRYWLIGTADHSMIFKVKYLFIEYILLSLAKPSSKKINFNPSYTLINRKQKRCPEIQMNFLKIQIKHYTFTPLIMWYPKCSFETKQKRILFVASLSDILFLYSRCIRFHYPDTDIHCGYLCDNQQSYPNGMFISKLFILSVEIQMIISLIDIFFDSKLMS